MHFYTYFLRVQSNWSINYIPTVYLRVFSCSPSGLILDGEGISDFFFFFVSSDCCWYESRVNTNRVWNLLPLARPQGLGYSHFFSSYVGLGTVSTVYKGKHIQNIKHAKKNLQTQNIPPFQVYTYFCTFTLRKDIKYIEITSPIFWWPQNILKSSYRNIYSIYRLSWFSLLYLFVLIYCVYKSSSVSNPV